MSINICMDIIIDLNLITYQIYGLADIYNIYIYTNFCMKTMDTDNIMLY